MVQELDKGTEAEAIYVQLLTYFRERILDGSFSVGSRLPTEVEIARQHHISRGTVRQALNILVNEGFLERIPGRGTFVKKLAEPEQHPTNKRLGLVLSLPTLQLSMDILVGAVQAAKARSYEVSVVYAENNPQEQARDVNWLKATQINGIILFPVDNAVADETLLQLQTENVPLVLIDRYIPNFDTDYVVSDNVGGGYRATEHLIILGHTRIGFAYSNVANLQTTSVRDRWRGYKQALQEYNLIYDEALIFPDLPLPPPGVPNAYDDFVLHPHRPEAVFAVNDSVALAILQACQRQGVKVPEHLALVGFDDLNFAAYLTPPLTTVVQPRREIGVRATNLLISRIEGQAGAPQHVEIPTSLTVRASCGVRLRLKHLLPS
jgi:GntR family transcriptional regulator, arabinose operon transcriptional repressor